MNLTENKEKKHEKNLSKETADELKKLLDEKQPEPDESIFHSLSKKDKEKLK